MDTIIEVEHLRKAYGAQVAVQDISFTVRRGEIFGVVGPNGAGKTTTIESLIGLRQPDGGQLRVLGLDPQKQERELRQRIGAQLQQAALPDALKVWEALALFASFYERTDDWRTLIKQWGLAEKRNAPFGKLSGGQKQRLFIALALLNTPEVVFLDELTTGLDPQARRHTWELVRAVRERGKTVVLVTHFMDEAEQLCDRVAFIDHGRVVALDTPARLIQQARAETRILFTLDQGFDPMGLRGLPEVSEVRQTGQTVMVSGGGPLMARVATALAERGIIPPDLRTERVTLEDVFLSHTGTTIRD